MIDRLPVSLVFLGEPFDRTALLHTFRHLAMRAGWQLTEQAPYRVVHTTISPRPEEVTDRDIVILSSPAVGHHLRENHTPIPLFREPDGRRLPFPIQNPVIRTPGTKINGDVLAGAFALMQLWYEQRTRPVEPDGWIRFAEDWWTRAGLSEPTPLADEWLDRIAQAAEVAHWPRTSRQQSQTFVRSPLTLVLTHDVDYLPTRYTRGAARLVRAMVRQMVSRRRPVDAIRLCIRYLSVFLQQSPYWTFPLLMREEGRLGMQSS